MPKVDAIITAGGKGTRLKKLCTEKPLVKIFGIPMIEYVLNAVSESRLIREIFVSVSPFTPKTKEYVEKKGFKVIKTPGLGYVEDLKYSMNYLSSPHVFVCPADMPLLRGESIDMVIKTYFKWGRSSLVVGVPFYVTESLGITSTFKITVDGQIVVPRGVSVVNRNKMLNKDHLDEKYLITETLDFAVNVNTINDLKVARKILSKRFQCLRERRRS